MSSEPGTRPAGDVVPLSVPEIRGNEWHYVKECLDTNWVSSAGPFVERFELMLAARTGARYAVATTSGTAALHIALLVAGVQPDDEVLVSALSFIAPANAVRYVGGWPVFVDAAPDHWQMDAQKLADFLGRECSWRGGVLRNRVTGRRVRAILPVHVLGHPCDMDPILELARQHELVVIEDATESLGARYKERPVGHLGDIACLSFNGNKIITTGGGGMLVTDRDEWARRARYLTTQAKDDPIEYIHEAIGYNYRLANVLAAIGVAQMEQLDSYIAAKRRIAAAYADAFAALPGIAMQREAQWAFSICWLSTVLVDAARFGMDSRALLCALNARGIQTRPLWQPLHLSPAHAGCQAYHCETVERLYAAALSLPSSVGLMPSDQQRVIDAVVHLGREGNGVAGG